MINLESFRLCKDTFYQDDTVVTFPKGLTLLRGINYDAGPNADTSNGAGKTRIPQLLKAFIYNECDRGRLKQIVNPKGFKGNLTFSNTLTNDVWSFSADVKENEWHILRNGSAYIEHHKFSECQKVLSDQMLLSKKEWSNFVHITRGSIAVLLKSKDDERRKFLEEFFNIDDFYLEKLAEYKKLLEDQEKAIEKLEQDRARYNQVLSSLKDADDVAALKAKVEENTKRLGEIGTSKEWLNVQVSALKEQLSDWTHYYQAVLDAEGLPSSDELDAQTQTCQRQIVEAEQLTNTIAEVKRTAALLPPEREPPTPPDKEPPALEDIVALEKLQMDMDAKMQLISKYDVLKKSVPQVVDTYSGLKLERETLLNSIAITKLHLSLVGDGTSCSRCGQSLENVLHREDHASLRLKEKELAQRLSVVSAAIAAWERKESIEREMESVKAAAQAYPKFGRTLASVKEELATLKALDSEWARYRISKEAYARNEQVRETLLAKLTTLGYPDVLTREVPCVRSLQERVKKLKEGIACLSLVKSLRQRVLNYPAKADVVEKLGVLEREVQALEAEEAQLLSETGACRAKLSFVSSLLASKEELEGKLAASESLYNEYRILKALVKFFSPAGFKSYELRKRCEPLIDVANYWSPLFFSELHEWSLPKDYDSLEFLVQPVAHRKSVAPFPARLLSAGEENRAERILLFAQLGLAPKNKTVNTLFLDEIEGNLDAAGRTLFTEVVIPKLKETFPDRCIVIISHDDSMKNLSCIDHLWLVERRNRKSTLKVFENSGGNVA